METRTTKRSTYTHTETTIDPTQTTFPRLDVVTLMQSTFTITQLTIQTHTCMDQTVGNTTSTQKTTASTNFYLEDNHNTGRKYQQSLRLGEKFPVCCKSLNSPPNQKKPRTTYNSSEIFQIFIKKTNKPNRNQQPQLHRIRDKRQLTPMRKVRLGRWKILGTVFNSYFTGHLSLSLRWT